MTLIPDKHTFTIWQGSTFFEVLTLYSTSDQTQPRDFYNSNFVTDVTVTTNNNSYLAVLNIAAGNINTRLAPDTKYYISSAHIPAALNVYFSTPSSIPNGNQLQITLYQNGLPNANGIGAGSNESATINHRASGYGVEMIIRDKPKGAKLLTLSTNLGNSIVDNINPTNTNCKIVLPDDLNSLGQIQIIIDDVKTSAITWKTGIYDLTLTEILNPVTNSATTDALLYGGIKVAGV